MIDPPLPAEQITHRPLPDHDETVDLLTDPERVAAGERWIGRSHNELETGRAFDYIARALSGLGADPQLVALAVRSADDEIRHSEICRRVASVYLGREVPPASLKPAEGVPSTSGVRLSPELQLGMFIVEMSCLSEGIGTAVLEANLSVTTTPLSRAALRELLSDEVNHARLGWAYLASVEPAWREEISEHLLQSMKRVFIVWDYRNEYPTTPRLATHGCPPIGVIRPAILSGIRDLALPGFAHVGVSAASSVEWFRAIDATG
jgi:hypothetical protein